MTDSHDIMTLKQKRKKLGENERALGPVGLFNFIFVIGLVAGGVGATQSIYIHNTFCDISLLTKI